jgi:glycosyltransferase involved in cell wall biosynthesis
MVNLAYDPRIADTDTLLNRYVQLTGCAEGVAQAGASVTVFQRFVRNAEIKRNGVAYRFVADKYRATLRLAQIPWRLTRAIAVSCAAAVAKGDAVVLHVNGMLFPMQTALLRLAAPRECAIVAQNHAEMPRLARRLPFLRLGLRAADAFFFAVRELAQPWIDRGVIRPSQPIYEIMECSSALTYQERDAARRQTGMRGNPVVLWTGNLTPQKDPLTVLAGFARIVEALPEARLYMAYRETPLLPEVQQRIAADDALKRSVTLLGEIPYDAIGPTYNSADFFVQGSAYGEGSGIALLDAQVCGVTPVVPNLPAFRAITAGGTLGRLWPPRDESAFVAAFLELARQPSGELAAQARAYFAEHWSFPAIGRSSVAAYREIVAKRGQRAGKRGAA